jgi:tetratricopeptide (TPR) repeat protein
MLARGDKEAKETSTEQFAAMRALLDKASEDLRAAQSIEPQNSIAAAKLVTIARYVSSRDETRQTFDRYRALLPRSYAVVMAFTRNLQVRWGGNPSELATFADKIAVRADLNPDFALIPSYGACLLADDLRGVGRMDDAEKLKELAALRYAGKLETWCYSKELVERAERNRQIAERVAGPVDATSGRLPEQQHASSVAEGRQLLDKLLVTQHGDASLYCRRAWYSYRESSYEQARDFVTRGIAIDPREPTCVRESAKLARLKRPLMLAPTVAALASAVQDASRDEGLHFEYALALVDAGRMDAAEAQFTEAIALDDRFNGAWYRRGWVRARTGQPVLAIADFDKAIEISPKPAAYWAERGRAHLLLEQFDAAAQDLAQAERRDGNDVKTQTYLATLYERTRDCRRVDAYRKVAAFCEKQHCDAEQTSMAAKLALPELREACGKFVDLNAGAP